MADIGDALKRKRVIPLDPQETERKEAPAPVKKPVPEKV